MTDHVLILHEVEDYDKWKAVFDQHLCVFGSVMGFALYYHVLKHMKTGKVALIAPVLALPVGSALNGEHVGLRVWAGTLLIGAALRVHQWRALSGIFTKSDQLISAPSSRRAAHFSRASSAGHSACPQSVMRYSTFGGT